MRGDRPQKEGLPFLLAKFTPHARGSTDDPTLACTSNYVYPACAGIDLYSDDHNLL